MSGLVYYTAMESRPQCVLLQIGYLNLGMRQTVGEPQAIDTIGRAYGPISSTRQAAGEDAHVVRVINSGTRLAQQVVQSLGGFERPNHERILNHMHAHRCNVCVAARSTSC